MSNLHADLLNITARRRASRSRTRRMARVAQFVSDGMAIVATIALIGALTLLAGVLASEANAPTYALVVTDDAGEMWVMDYNMTYDDCREERAMYALGVAMCDPAKG